MRQQSWAEEGTHGKAQVPQTIAQGIGAVDGSSAYEGSACEASLQTPWRTMDCSETLPHTSFIQFFCF